MQFQFAACFRLGGIAFEERAKTHSDDVPDPHGDTPYARSSTSRTAEESRSHDSSSWRELFSPRGCEGVKLGFASKIRIAPFRFDPALVLKPVQRRVERTLLHG